MNTIRVSTTIHQPVEKVFKFTWDPQTIRLWLPEPSESIPLASGTEPTVARSHTKVRGPVGLTLEMIQETIEFVPNHRYISRAHEIHGWIVSQSRWDFEPVPEGTRVTVQHDVELHGWLQWGGPIFFLIARKKVEGDLLRLKKLLEKS